MAEEDFTLTVGSRYLVKSMLTREQAQETEGVFRGITTVGTNDSMILEVPGKGGGKGRIRVIPTHMVLSIDVLEAAARPEGQKKRGDAENVHYG